jgi:RNA polymerase sigma-70 factor (ECF subfamily)
VAKLSTWLHNIAHNLCIDYFRKHKRLVPWTEDSDKSEDNQPGGIEPDMAFLSRIDADNVKRSITALPERQRSAILLCHYQGLSNKDAALILDVSVDALESLLARGRKKLRALLSEGVPVE